MALTGLDIYKLLPKTNCGECKSPTCLAFAMRVAQKQASIEECPDITDEAKEQLGAASAPPIQLVTIGTGDAKVEIGNETVLEKALGFRCAEILTMLADPPEMRDQLVPFGASRDVETPFFCARFPGHAQIDDDRIAQI